MKGNLGLAMTRGRRLDSIALALIRRPANVILVIALMAIFTGAVMSRVEKAPVPVTGNAPTTMALPARGAAPTSSRFQSRLSFQPEANKMRRRLGQRYTKPGREVTMSSGTLTLDGQAQSINIVRTQDDQDGERVAITVGGGSLLSWNPRDGAMSNGRIPNAKEKGLIERIVLDSPDQFILAQVRAASYYTIARAVRPAEAGDSESYAGPFWDLIRIAEPRRNTGNKPQSEWRIFYINASTALIDRVLYQEQGEAIMVEFSGWTSRGGEFAPALTRWSRGAQVVMELGLNNVGYGSR